jgi:RsiW-degrading membrane proteinase PrsW (M82 family)
MADVAPGGSPDHPAPPPAGGSSAVSHPDAPTTPFTSRPPASDDRATPVPDGGATAADPTTRLSAPAEGAGRAADDERTTALGTPWEPTTPLSAGPAPDDHGAAQPTAAPTSGPAPTSDSTAPLSAGPASQSTSASTAPLGGHQSAAAQQAAGPPTGAEPHTAPALGDPGQIPAGPGQDPAAAAAVATLTGVAPNGRRTGWRRWLPLVGVIGFIAVCAVVMLLILGFSNGVTGLLIGLGAAILPVPVLVGCFLWLDRYEPEPTRYLVFCFAWGSAVATLASLGVNTGAAWLFDNIGLPEALVAVLVAPFIEETMKTLGPILLLWRRRREWSGITDGIVYCGLSAIGFAMVENVLYLGGHGYAAGADQYGPATGIQNVFLIFIVRILFTGFAHPLFTSMAGVGLGLASRSGDRRVKWLAPIAGLLLAMILHGLFNLLPTLSVATGQTLIMLYGYLGFMVPFFFLTVGFAIALRGWEGRLSERVLPYYVRTGWLSPPEVAALGNLGRRHSARRWARRVAGQDGLKAMRGFQFAATQLAILRDGMQRGLDRKPDDFARSTAEEQRLLTAISGYRAVFVGRDPQMPRAFWDGNQYTVAFPDGVDRTVAAPAEPVMPLPVRLAPPVPVAAGYGAGGYGGQPAPWPGAGYGTPPPGYGPPPAYGTPPGSGPGYGAPPAYGTPPGSGPGYAVPPASGPAYGAPPASGPGYHGAGPGYGMPPAGGPGHYGAPQASGPGYGAGGPGSYGPPPVSGPGYGAPPASGPGYGPPGGAYGPPPSGPGYYTPPPVSGSGYGPPPVSGSGYGPPPVSGPGYGPPAGPSPWAAPPADPAPEVRPPAPPN